MSLDLCQSFRDLSYQTWKYLGNARSVDHQILEETVTDNLMVDLKVLHPHNLFTKTFTRNEEGKNGADWEWWFVDSTCSSGIGFRVQAKIINFKSDKFEQLHYIKNKGKSGEISQSEVLKTNALKSGLIPLYCLYINSDTLINNLNNLNILQFIRFLPFGVSHELYGCSILSFKDLMILKKSSSNSLKDLLTYIFPWHALVCSNYCDENTITTLSLLDRVKKLIDAHSLNVQEQNLSVVKELPIYIKNIINSNNLSTEDNSNEFNDNNLRGIMILKDKD